MIQLLSDLHFEFHKDHGQSFVDTTPVTGEILVLAGDICTLKNYQQSVPALQTLVARYARTLYVPGNHEFYDIKSWDRAAKRLQDMLAVTGMTLLQPGVIVEIGATRFLGGTLWFPWQVDNTAFLSWMSDTKLIPDYPNCAYDENSRVMDWLEAELRPGDVVITHHLPCEAAVAERFQNNELNRFFVADCGRLIRARRPRYWLHGHTHDSVDIRMGETRIRANPFGYVRYELNRDFDPGCCLPL